MEVQTTETPLEYISNSNKRVLISFSWTWGKDGFFTASVLFESAVYADADVDYANPVPILAWNGLAKEPVKFADGWAYAPDRPGPAGSSASASTPKKEV